MSTVEHPWVHDIELTPALTEELARTGAVKLAGFLRPQALDFLRELCATEELEGVSATVKKGGERRQVMSSRGRNIGNKDPQIKQMVRSPGFARALAHLVPEPLLFTKGMVFEVRPGDFGYHWHFGVKAFQFIRPTDPGYSLWIPLHAVGPETGGGIAYVPAEIWSGRERAKLVSHLLAAISAAEGAKRGELVDQMAAEYASLSFVTDYEREVLGPVCVEPSFEPGDVLLFSRWIWHRSKPFFASAENVEEPRRVAYTMRFVGSESRISKAFIENLRRYYKLRKKRGRGSKGGSGGSAPFSELDDGDLIRNSADSFPVFSL